MAIAIDSRQSGTYTTGASSLSWSHTVGSISNGILVVGSGEASGSNFNVSSVVWDSGGANTALSNTVNGTAARKNDTATQGWAELWYLLAPASGTKTVKVTYGGSTAGGTGSVSLSGVAQSSTFNASSPQTSSGSDPTQPSLTVTSSSGEWVIDCVDDNKNTNGDALTNGASQNLISTQGSGSTGVTMGMSDESSGGASVTMSWTGVTTSAPWSQVAFSLLAAGAATATGWGQLVVNARNNPVVRF